MSKSIGQEIKTSIENLDYNAVCRLTQYVKDSFASIDANESMKFHIQFNMGEIQIVLDDFDEFCRTAYGQEIDVVSVRVSNYPHRIYVHMRKFNSDIQQKASLSISCEDVSTLVNMCKGIESRLVANGELLRIQKQQRAKATPTAEASAVNVPIAQTPQSPQSNITINVGGDFNMSGSAIGSNNKAENEGVITTTVEKNKDVKQEETSFWKGVWQQVVANGVWWILGVIVASILAYLGLA